MSDQHNIALSVRMSEDQQDVEVVSGDGHGPVRIYTLSPEQAHRFGMTMMMCAQQAQARRALT